ncbi:hypothetical protein DY251_16840 [Mesorhizobium denitrificans]|uniref:Uncharacterized protein n=2 Tax=Mesorhizobium TaxID=68287 RepID=A0A371X902_9HYPH|nr:hypothetical protein DY251_16840 [Mesorhizobium denitrificans]
MHWSLAVFTAIKRLKEPITLSPSDGCKAMLNIIADSTDLTTLTSVLDEYCTQHRVFEIGDRDECARRILALFSLGVTSRHALLERMNRVVV